MDTDYKYYRIGNWRPIRATICPEIKGAVSATYAPDPNTGELVLTMALISRLDGDDTWEIDEAEFKELLAAYQARIRRNYRDAGCSTPDKFQS